MLFLLILALGVIFMVVTVLGTVSIKFKKTISGLVTSSENVTITDNNAVQANPPVLAGQPGVLTTHTTNTTGTLTMTNSNHGIITGQRIDISWTGGHCYGAIAGTVSGLTVPIASVSGGTALPASLTAVTVMIPTSTPFNCIGNNVTALVLDAPKTGYFVFNDGASDVYAVYVTGGNVQTWKTGDVDSNPLAGATPTKVYMSTIYTGGTINNMQAAAAVH